MSSTLQGRIRAHTVRSAGTRLSIWRRLMVAAALVIGISVGGVSVARACGETWTARTHAVDNSWRGVTYGNGLFVAVSSSGTNDRVMTSPDGINWTSRTSAADNNWNSVTYGNGMFVAVANSGTGNRVMTSPDGINWTSQTSAADNSWRGVAFGGNRFVAVSSTGVTRVMTSDASNCPSGSEPSSGSTSATRSGPNLYWADLDTNGGTCQVDGVAISKTIRTPFLGYRYIPSADECTKPGATFAGWASKTSPTTVLALPRLIDWNEQVWRFFIADHHDLIAVWK